MNPQQKARATITVDAPAEKVWAALVTPASIKEYMFGTHVTSTFKPESPITWRGEWKGKPYEDKGTIKKADPGRVLEYTHYSPMTGLPDVPENYHTVTVELTDRSGKTLVTLVQDGIKTDEEKQHSEANWKMMLDALKKFVEK